MKILRQFVTWEDGRVTTDGRPPRDPEPPLSPATRAPFHPPAEPEPTAIELVTNFSAAMARLAGAAAAGKQVWVSQQDYEARRARCEPCEYWDGQARLGLGKCNVRGCGCTKFKRWLATETCRHPAGSRWPVLQAVATNPFASPETPTSLPP